MMMRRLLTPAISTVARLMGADKPVRLTPDYALLPEILVVADGFQGEVLLRQVREHDHLSVYWPGRGERYLAGRTAARVTILSGGHRLSREERTLLAHRTRTWGDRALWLEFAA